MLVFKSLILLTLLQGIYSYCIYNKFTDTTSFTVSYNMAGAQVQLFFKQHLEASTNACCHYKNTDCAPGETNKDPVSFSITIHTFNGKNFETGTSCTSGGALYIRGTIESYFAECVDVNGNSKVYELPTLP